ncbi:MAG: alpha-amylase family protein [Candidatus Latescibacterota bacterium]
MSASRRSFLTYGVSAGAGLSLATLSPSPASAGTRTVSGSFDILGIQGSVQLILDEDVPDGSAFQIRVEKLTPRTALAHIRFSIGKRLTVRKLTVSTPVPLRDVQKIWYSQQLDGMGQHAYIGLPWSVDIPAAGHQGSLIAGALNRYGRNLGVLALKNQSGDGSITFGNGYAGKFLNMAVNRFAEGRPWHTDEIDETVYLNIEDIHWLDAVSQFVGWYDTAWNLSYNTPRACFEPVWNTWYPSLGKINDEFIERNARKCVELGFKTLIIDDGWFAAAGDWEPKREAFPDFRATIDRIHALGLRVIIWYRPFGLDARASAAAEWSKYSTTVQGKSTGNLCPRCREVQERAGRITGDLMERYGLDGLKIDFLDASQSAAPLVNCEAGHRHDFDFVSDGVRETMRLIAESMRRVRQDAIIEYRLNYSNIANRIYGNCYRGQDTPSDPDLGRRHLALLRSWCRGIAPHSDPNYWALSESDENVARYLATSMLYAVPTLSVNFPDLQPNHLELVRTWLAFYTEHQERMHAGKFDILSDDPHYSVARISSGGRTYLPCFLPVWPSTLPILPEHAGTIILFNGTERPRITTRLEGVTGTFRLTTTDMFHRPTGKTYTVKSAGGALPLDHPVDVGGLVYLRKV